MRRGEILLALHKDVMTREQIYRYQEDPGNWQMVYDRAEDNDMSFEDSLLADQLI
jgi:hypothetical protein